MRAFMVFCMAAVCGCNLTIKSSAGVASFRLTATPTQPVAGKPVSISLAALDTAGQVVTGYTGTVRFTSTDSAAMGPSSYTFTAADRGQAMLTEAFTFVGAGAQSLNAVDSVRPAVLGALNLTIVAAQSCHLYGQPFTAPAALSMSQWTPIKSLVADSAGHPVLAWTAAGTNGATASYIQVRRWTGISWSDLNGGVQTAVSADFGYNGSPAVAVFDGNPQVAWARGTATPTTPYATYVGFKSYNGSTWTDVGGSGTSPGLSGSFTVTSEPSVSLALDAAGAPWAAWDTDTPFTVRARVAADAVSFAPPAGSNDDVAAGDALHPALTGLPGGGALLAWTHDEPNTPRNILVARNTGSGWQALGDSLGSTGISGAGIDADHAAVVVDASGNPIVAYEGSSDGNSFVHVQRFNGTRWYELTGPNALLGQHPAVAFDGQGNLMLAWEHPGKVTTELYLISYNGITWQDLGGSSIGSGVTAGSVSVSWPQLDRDENGAPLLAWEEWGTNAVLISVCRWY